MGKPMNEIEKARQEYAIRFLLFIFAIFNLLNLAAFFYNDYAYITIYQEI